MSDCLAGLPEQAVAVFRRWEGILADRLSPLPDQPAESVHSTLAALWHAAAGRPLSSRTAVAVPLAALDADGEARLAALVERRLAGTPLAHLTGRQHFMGLEMLASEAALIPREETELLGQAALEALSEVAGRNGTARAIDLCTGSGNLALALARHEPRAQIWGADLSSEAVAFARENAKYLGLSDRVTFVTGDLLEPFDSVSFAANVDVVVCNPPYISTAKLATMADEIREHEPRLAFDGGPFGIRILARLLEDAPRVLRNGGVLAFEVGLGQGPGIARRLRRQGGYADVTEITDSHGEMRALLARWEDRGVSGASAQ